MKLINKINDKIENGVTTVAAVMLIGIIVIIVMQVVVRAVGIPMSGSEELARYLYVLFVFWLWPLASRRGSDLRITVVYDLLPQKFRSILMGVYNVTMLYLGYLCVRSSYMNMTQAKQHGVVLPQNTYIQLWVIYLLVMLACVYLMIAIFLRAVMLFTGQEIVITQKEENDLQMAAAEEAISKELEKEAAEGGTV